MKTKIYILLVFILLSMLLAVGCNTDEAQANQIVETVKPTTAETVTETSPETNPSLAHEVTESGTIVDEKTTIAPEEEVQTDYSSYLGTWEYVYDNDGQLDENYAVVTSVTFNEIDDSTANITIFKGNISKVCQIDITGDIKDDKIEFSYDKDGWENSGHGTINLNGDSIHLYAKVDSYGPNARMGLECDNDLMKHG